MGCAPSAALLPPPEKTAAAVVQRQGSKEEFSEDKPGGPAEVQHISADGLCKPKAPLLIVSRDLRGT
eukprot:SAG31_NODE_1780_length_7290_cov_1.784036_4_plen_67_part_00